MDCETETKYREGVGQVTIEPGTSGKLKVTHDQNDCSVDAEGEIRGCTRAYYGPSEISPTLDVDVTTSLRSAFGFGGSTGFRAFKIGENLWLLERVDGRGPAGMKPKARTEVSRGAFAPHQSRESMDNARGSD